MSPQELESLVLGVCINFPNGKDNIPQRVSYELDSSRFGDVANLYVFDAMKKCVRKNLPPNIANLALEMDGTLEKAGGIEYIESLQRFPNLIGVYDASSIGEWVRKVDLLGRARLIHTVLNRKIGIPLDGFQQQVLDAEDPDAFLGALATEINRYMVGTKSNYQPFSNAVEIVEQKIRAALRGESTDILPCGIPNLEKHCIPRPRSFGVIAGISSQGKTQFALYVAIGVAIGLQKRGERGQVTINTLEEMGEDLAMRVACMMSNTNSREIAQGTISHAQADRILEKCAYIKELPIVYNDDPSLNSYQFVTHAICQHMKVPRVLGITDYVELFMDKAEKEEARVAQATRNVRSVCWETNSCEVMLVQLNDDATKNTYKTGGMFASRNSRAPAHAADWWIEILNYPELRKAQMKVTIPDRRDANLAYALIEKGRKYGKGEEPFEWVAEYTMFRDISLLPGQLYGEISQEDDF